MSSDVVEPMDEAYRRARKRAEELQGLFIHTIVFVVINAGLFFIDAVTGNGWWAYWPLLGWGIGYAIHVLVTVVPVFSDEWVERRAEQIAHKS